METFRVDISPMLEDALRQLPERIAKKVLRAALRKGAKTVAALAAANAPVDTGFLREHIKVVSLKRSRKRIGVQLFAGAAEYKGKAYYASFIEYGHRVGKRTAAINREQKVIQKLRRKSRDDGGLYTDLAKQADEMKAELDRNDTRDFVPPRPFMRPALDAKGDDAVKIITDEILKGVEREANSVASLKTGKRK